MTIKSVGQLSHEHLGQNITVTTPDGLFVGLLSYVSHDMVQGKRASCVTVAISDALNRELNLDTLLYLPAEAPCSLTPSSTNATE